MKALRFTLRGFRRPREVVRLALGKLEREVMEEIWRRGESNVREVHAAFGERAAYTTLMTTLDRLYRKGPLHRQRASAIFSVIRCVLAETWNGRSDACPGLLLGPAVRTV